MFPTKSSSAQNVCLRAHLLLCASDSACKKFTPRLRLIELRPQFLVRLMPPVDADALSQGCARGNSGAPPQFGEVCEWRRHPN
jgi:hypothetical protein